MRNQERSISLKRVITVLLTMSAGLLLGSAWSAATNKPFPNKPAQTQELPKLAPKPEKYIGKYMTFPNEPLEILELKVKEKSIQLDSRIKESNDWMNGLKFKVRNISGKNIVYFVVYLVFPETKSDQPIMAYRLRYGADPKTPHQPNEEKTLAPNEETEFVISGNTYEKLKRFVERRIPLTSINVAVIDIGMVVFDDDTAWATGGFMRRDPANPLRWVDN